MLERGYRICFVAWLILVLLAGCLLINGYRTVTPDPSGMAFTDQYLKAAIPAFLAFLVPIFALYFKPNRKGVLICLVQLFLTWAAANAATGYAEKIEFERTPPCWGMHSIDPGSGAGCPDGMSEDFTVEQLRTWYASQRTTLKPRVAE